MLAGALAAALIAGLPVQSRAQAPMPVATEIVRDATLGSLPAGPIAGVRGPAGAGKVFTIGEQDGSRPGGGVNLFHSFGTFNLGSGDTARFTADPALATQNVVSRVTGGVPSSLFGTLRSEIPGADFFFLNPAGIVFGPGAQLDVPGSFHASSADRLSFVDPDGNQLPGFSGDVRLAFASPAAFGFLGAGNGAVEVRGSALKVTRGRTLSLVGGDVRITGGSLTAPSGQLWLLSADSVGEVAFDQAVASRPPDVSSLAQLGAIQIDGGARLTVSGAPGGSVVLRAGSLEMRELSLLEADSAGGAGAPIAIDLDATDIVLQKSAISSTNRGSAGAGEIVIHASRLVVDGGLPDFFSFSRTFIGTSAEGARAAGKVTVDASRLEVRNGGEISSVARSGGGAGSVEIRADEVLVSGDGSLFSTGITSETGSGTGKGGAVGVTAGRLEVRNGGEISSATRSGGGAGSVEIHANEVLVSGDGSPVSTAIGSAALAGTGKGGTVLVTAGRLEVRSGGEIYSDTLSNGDAGRVEIRADEVLVSGDGSPGGTGIASGARAGRGKGGVVLVTAGRLEVRNGGVIASATFSSGDAGRVEIHADEVLVSGDGSLDSTGIFGDAVAGLGKGGAVLVTAGRLEVRSGGEIGSNTHSSGDAGSVEIRADEVLVSGDGSPGGTGISSEALAGRGKGGAVLVTAGRLEVRSGGVIASDTFSRGDAGNVEIRADEVLILGDGLPDFTGISSDVLAGTGKGGAVLVTTGRLEVRSSGEISSDTSTSGDAGSIEIRADEVLISGDESLYFTGISSEALAGTGQGGEVEVTAGRIEVRNGGQIASDTFSSGAAGRIGVQAESILLDQESEISSSTLAQGDGGSIAISARSLDLRSGAGIRTDATEGATGDAGDIGVSAVEVALDQSEIAARNRGVGKGGNIDLQVADQLLLDGGSSVTANVATGDDANVRIGNLQAPARAVILRSASRITAQAEAAGGKGGRIEINAQGLFRSPESVISASAPGGPEAQGVVEVNSPETNVEGDLHQLSAQFLDAAALFRPSCMARAGGEREGSFTVAKRRGLPASPEELLLAFETGEGEDLSLAASADEGEEPPAPRAEELPAVAAARPGAPPGLEVAQASAQGAEAAFRGGRFAEAQAGFSAAAQAPGEGPARRGDSLAGLAESQQALGHYAESLAPLERALALAEQSGDARRIASALGSLGNASLALGEREAAREFFTRALAQADAARDPGLEAALHLDRGNLASAEGRFEAALVDYEESARLSHEAASPVREAQALASAARAALEASQLERSLALLEQTRERTAALPSSHAKALLLLHRAKTHERMARASRAARAQNLLAAHGALLEVSEFAKELGDGRSLSYAYGNLGALYEGEGRNEEALHLTRLARRAAEEAEAPELLYRWHGQEGRILWAAGQRGPALEAYRRAIAILEETRQETQAQYGSAEVAFRERVAPVYLELVDALLQSSAQDEEEAAPSRALLLEARSTVEKLKAAELRDYFRDECVADLEAKAVDIDQVVRGGRAAVVYPVQLHDRIELLVTLPTGGLRRYAVAVPQERATAEIHAFRRLLEKRATQEYRPHAEQLYDWLVRPYEEALREEGVETLVFVPGGALRTIPMAALHDGQQFLAEHFAVAVAPGLSLIAPQPLDRAHARVLLGGVSEPVAGFAALPGVPGELEAVRALYGGEVLLNEDFRRDRLEAELKAKQPTIVHIASHARITGDARKSVLVTHEGELDLESFGALVAGARFREQPLELLALSACETAAGDERAALGLAGVGIRAGARSALGSLWSVSDEAASELVVEFYRQLKDPEISRAQALRRAQQKLLADARYTHPFFWAPFLLISNWL
jgi:filamentous hemagglutinin family protein